MTQGEKAHRPGETGTARVRGRGRRRILGAVALAGAIAAASAPAQLPAAAASAGAHEPACPPGEAGPAARVAGPERDDTGTVTAEQAAQFERQLREARDPLQAPSPKEPQTVPVVLHVITAEDGTGDLSDATVKKQIDTMNTAFGGGFEGADTGFRFELSKVTRTANDAWFTRFSSHEDEIKASLREGDAGTLNLYSARLREGVLGQSTFPQEYRSSPKRDGVVIDHRTVPGGGRPDFDRGITAVHETGHWLGLFHTFQNGCSKPGDYVEDTPYEREQASGCPEGRDTCANKPGADPVHNFMDYSDDACMNQFTKGQGRRMAESWAAFRA